MWQLDSKTIIPWLLTLAALLVGVWQYVDKTAQSSREPFLREQLKFAIEASESAAVLATTTDVSAFARARERFFVLYWGPLSLVENREVEGRMKDFRAALVKQGLAPPAQPPTEDAPTELQLASIRLALALRTMIAESWGADLEALRKD